MLPQEPEKQPENPAEEVTGDPDASTEDFAGYASLDEMRNAVYASRKEGKRLADINAAQAAQLSVLSKPAAAAEKRALDEINDLGLPADTFRRAVKDELREELSRELAPMVKTQAAIANVRATHPTFSKMEPDFNRWLAANPDVAGTYNQAVADSPTIAEPLLRGMFAEFELTRRPAASAEPKKVGSDAKLPGKQSSGAARKEPDTKLGREEMRELIKDARRTGDPVEIMRSLLGGKSVHRDIEPQKR